MHIHVRALQKRRLDDEETLIFQNIKMLISVLLV